MPRTVVYLNPPAARPPDALPTAVVGPAPRPDDPPALGALLVALWVAQMEAADLVTALDGHRCRRDRGGVCRLCEAARQAEAADVLLDYLEKGLGPHVLSGTANVVALGEIADAAFFRLTRAVERRARREGEGGRPCP